MLLPTAWLDEYYATWRAQGFVAQRIFFLVPRLGVVGLYVNFPPPLPPLFDLTVCLFVYQDEMVLADGGHGWMGTYWVSIQLLNKTC